MMSATNAQLLPPGLLRDLQSLNLRFLHVLCRATRENDGAAAVHGLPATLAVRLAELDEGQLREISACPCSLFAVDWTRLLNAAAGIAEAAAWRGSDDPRGRNLCTALIVFAARLARTRLPALSRARCGRSRRCPRSETRSTRRAPRARRGPARSRRPGEVERRAANAVSP